MIGISQNTWIKAYNLIGSMQATVAVLSILERLQFIRNPGGYLMSLAKKISGGEATIEGLVRSLEQQKFTAVNFTPENRIEC